MASLQDIRRRITSVRNTRKITKALELVAGARLRRAQTRIEEMRPYADRMMELMVGTARAASSFRNLPLLQRREVHRIALLVFTGAEPEKRIGWRAARTRPCSGCAYST